MLFFPSACLDTILDNCRNDNSLPALCCVNKGMLEIVHGFCERNKGHINLSRSGSFLDEMTQAALYSLSQYGYCIVPNAEKATQVRRTFFARMLRKPNLTICYLACGQAELLECSRQISFDEDVAETVFINPKLPDVPEPDVAEKKIKFYFEFEFEDKGETSIDLSNNVVIAVTCKYADLRNFTVIYVSYLSGQIICNLLLRYAICKHKVVLRPNESNQYKFFPMPVGTPPSTRPVCVNTLAIKRSVTYNKFYSDDEKGEDCMKSPYLISSKNTLESKVRGRHRWKSESRDLTHTFENLSQYINANYNQHKIPRHLFLRVVDLRRICREQGLPAEGTRSDLLQRLRNHLKN